MNKYLIGVILSLMLASFYPWSAKADEGNIAKIIVTLAEGVSVDDFLLANNLTAEQIKVGRNGRIMIMDDQIGVKVQTNTDWKKVTKVDIDGEATILNTKPNDKYYTDIQDMQWNLKKIGMETVWNDYRGNKDVVAAVVDTGLNYKNEDMSDLLWVNEDEIPNNGIDDDNNGYVDDRNGYNFIKASSDIDDDNDHGTAVTSIIAANTNNKTGMAGVCWQATIMPLKVANANGSASLFDIAQAIYYAVDNGAKVVNLSLGALVDQEDMRESVAYAAEKGVVLVAAAGNSESGGQKVNSLYYPANYQTVLAVGATDKNDEVASLGNASFISHRGKNLDLVAPGVDILAATSGKDGDLYAKYDGTSMAVPQVVGAAALLWDKNKNLTGGEVEAALLLSAEKVDDMTADFDERYGNGRLDVVGAMDRVTKGLDDGENEDDFDFNLTAKKIDGGIKLSWSKYENTADSLKILRSTSNQNPKYPDEAYKSINDLTTTDFVDTSVNDGTKYYYRLAAYQDDQVVEYSDVVNIKYDLADDGGQDVTKYGNVFLAQWLGQSNYWYLRPGEKRKVWIEFKNVGDALWSIDGTNALHLATERNKDRLSGFFDQDSWLSGNRIAATNAEDVMPGEVLRFEFEILAPYQEGSYNEYFGLVSENKQWLNDMGVYWNFTVTNKDIYSAAWLDQSDYLTLNQGESGSSWVEFVNNGTASWEKEGVNAIHLGTNNPQDRASSFFDAKTWLNNNRIGLEQTEVLPGTVGRFSFGVMAKNLGTFTEYFRPIVENKEWLKDQGVFLRYTVTK